MRVPQATGNDEKFKVKGKSVLHEVRKHLGEDVSADELESRLAIADREVEENGGERLPRRRVETTQDRRRNP